MRQLMVGGMLMISTIGLQARSFGVFGEGFPVAEKSFLTLIEERLNALSLNGELDAMNKKWIDTISRHTERPTPLDLPRAVQKSVHYYSAEIVVGQDIKDINGNILYAKGTRVNALKSLPTYAPCWLFFNADDKAQMQWAAQQIKLCSTPKVILTGGSVRDAETQLQAVIYFDQEARISKKLKIMTVPSRVVREGNRLRIETVAIKENGDVL